MLFCRSESVRQGQLAPCSCRTHRSGHLVGSKFIKIALYHGEILSLFILLPSKAGIHPHTGAHFVIFYFGFL